VFDVAQGKLLSRYSIPADAFDPTNMDRAATFSWSPDGAKILVARTVALAIDLQHGTVDTIASQPIAALWAPSSDALYYLASEPDTTGVMLRRIAGLYRRQLGVPTPVKQLDRQAFVALGLLHWDPHGVWAQSPSGRKLAVWTTPLAGDSASREKTRVYLYDLSNGLPAALEHPARTVEIPNWWIVRAPEWSPDEHSLAMFGIHTVKDGNIEIRLLDAETGTWRTIARVATGDDGAEVFMLTEIRAMSWTR